MEAKELRIGNIIQQNGKPIVIISFWGTDNVDVDTAIVNFPTDDQHNTSLYYCTPVPIAEDWLLRMGFMKKHEDVYQKGEHFIINIRESRVIIEDFSDSVVLPERRYKFVHELQNLYFAITGIELTIEL